MFVCLHGCTHPHMSPILLCASVCSHRMLHVVGSHKGIPYVLGHFSYTTPVWGCLPFSCSPHTQLLASLCISMFWGYLYAMWGFFPFVRGFWGIPPLVGGSWGHISTCDAHMLILVHFVVHYVSHFYYGYNYYSSSYGGFFWPVISLISDSGFFPDRVSSKLGSAWSGSTTTLHAKRLQRCYWLHLQCLFWLMPIMLWVLHR